MNTLYAIRNLEDDTYLKRLGNPNEWTEIICFADLYTIKKDAKKAICLIGENIYVELVKVYQL